MKTVLQRWLADDGQDLVEYALLGSVIALASVLGVNAIRTAVLNAYGSWDAGTQAIWEPNDPQ